MPYYNNMSREILIDNNNKQNKTKNSLNDFLSKDTCLHVVLQYFLLQSTYFYSFSYFLLKTAEWFSSSLYKIQCQVSAPNNKQDNKVSPAFGSNCN